MCAGTASIKGGYVVTEPEYKASQPADKEGLCMHSNGRTSLESHEGPGLTKEQIGSLELRYFSPREVARLHSFPEDFSFPDHVTLRQQYALLGNSVSALVIGDLLKYLLHDSGQPSDHAHMLQT